MSSRFVHSAIWAAFCDFLTLVLVLVWFVAVFLAQPAQNRDAWTAGYAAAMKDYQEATRECENGAHYGDVCYWTPTPNAHPEAYVR